MQVEDQQLKIFLAESELLSEKDLEAVSKEAKKSNASGHIFGLPLGSSKASTNQDTQHRRLTRSFFDLTKSG